MTAFAIAAAVLLAPQAAAGPGPGTGTVVLYRGSTVLGAAIGCPIRYRDREIVELGRGRYAEWRVPAGRYAIGNKSRTVDVAVGPGETKYVRCTIRAGVFAGGSNLTVVDEQAFAEHRADYKVKEVNPDALGAAAGERPPS